MKQDIMIALVLSPLIAYCAYRAIKSALEPPEEIRGPDPDDPVACSYWDLYGEP